MHLLTRWVLSLPPYLMCAVPALVVLAEPALLVGVVLPSVGSMLLLGFLAHAGAVPLVPAMACGVAGATVGDSLAYLAGRRWSRRRDRLRRLVGAGRWDRAESFVLRFGGLAVVAARFLTGLRTLVPRLGGLSGMPYRRFLAFSAPAGAVWGAGFVAAGYLAGASYRRVASLLGTGGALAVGALAFAGLTALVALRLRRWRRAAVPDVPPR
ncbi:membrane protein [Actinocatenispora thailandica]|uniref:Membrane protein n=1 Tax=Actinocatenispora thailandica TaxID=227318 RepID=A0A7R7DQW1_9ACTN|nr:DedA family protein [Actinocatenispora thailandica]BCJ36225.1 membrane protein [Actinocatenispora thailandica]